MKPTTRVLIPVSLALLISGCQSMPEMSDLWQFNAEEQAPVAESESTSPTETSVQRAPTLKEQIETDLAANRLSKPSGNNAIEKIERLRKTSPNDPAIKRYEKAVIDRYLNLADKRIKRSSSRASLETALRYVNTARSLQVPSTALDKKEEEIIELLDIVIQKEQLLKAREAEVEQAIAKPAPAVELAPVEEQKPAEPEEPAVQPNPQMNNPNFLALNQAHIDSRSQDINLQLDQLSKRIVAEKATVVIHAQTMGDFRYLKSSLRTSLYWEDANFNLSAEPHIDASVSPGIEVVHGN